MRPDAPWRDRETLAPLLAAWRPAVAGRDLFRVVVGPGWVRLHLVGDDRVGLLLTALPAAVIACPFHAPLPGPLNAALRPTVGEPLGELLRGGRLADLALLADDLVLAVDIDTPQGRRRMRHQLFGSRGGLVVLDDGGRMLYTAHARPHPCLVAPSPRRDVAPPAAASADALAAWEEAGLHRLARQRETTLADALARTVTRAREGAERLVANLAADLARADGGEERRRDAETLAAYLHTVTRGQPEATLPDPRDGHERIIALDPALTPAANLERLFRLARKAGRGREVVAERLDDAREALAAITGVAAALEALLEGPTDSSGGGDAGDRDGTLTATLDRLAALQAFRAAHPELLSERATTGVQAPDEPSRAFRRYRIDDRWDVWVGRSSTENDQLTHRDSHPRDIWLHAQGVTGSHVILRTGGRPDQVPRHVLERAAALAALHSKARTSALVPVIHTERRYVRKPRRAPAGTAVCLREDNLFVAPAVAEGVLPA